MSLETWVRQHAIWWLAWRELASVVVCSRGAKEVLGLRGSSVLALSEGRLRVTRRGGTESEAPDILRAALETRPEQESTLLARLGRYLEGSPVGQAVFKEAFRKWPSPSRAITASLERRSRWSAPSKGAHASWEAWWSRVGVTADTLVYEQKGCGGQSSWRAVLDVTTAEDWRREPAAFALTMHYQHQTPSLSPFTAMLSLPLAFLGCMEGGVAWRGLSESAFLRYCLKRSENVLRHGYGMEEGTFERLALLDHGFPWEAPFAEIYEYLCRYPARFEDLLGFARAWKAAGLRPASFCLDCGTWVDARNLHPPRRARLGGDSWYEGGCLVVEVDSIFGYEVKEELSGLLQEGEDWSDSGRSPELLRGLRGSSLLSVL